MCGDGQNLQKFCQLNQIQEEIMDLVVDDIETSKISEITGLSEFTVSAVINSAIRTLGVRTLAHAAIIHKNPKNDL